MKSPERNGNGFRRRVALFVEHIIKRPELFFLIVAALAGLFIVIALPPYRGLDEASHVFRITQLSEGDLFMEKIPDGYGHPIPNYIQDLNINEFSQSKKSGFFHRIKTRYEAGKYPTGTGPPPTTLQTFEGSGSYSPIVYAHLLPVGALAKFAHLNAYIYNLLLRLFNLGLFIIAVYFAIKIIPIGKWGMVAVGLLPMSLHQSATISGDVILMASVAVFIALVLRLCVKSKNNESTAQTTRKFLIGVFLTGLLIGGSKPGYLLITLLAFAIPLSVFSTTKRKVIYCISLFVMCLLMLGTWSALLNYAGSGGAIETFRARVNGGGATITTSAIVKQTVLTPWRTIGLFSNTFIFEVNNSSLPVPRPIQYNAVPDFILSNFTGLFGSLNMALPNWASFMVLLNLTVGFLGFAHSGFSKKTRLIVWGIILAQCLGIFVVFWRTWTSTTMPHVWGLQGRYYIPLLPLLLFVVPKKSIFSWSENTGKVFVTVFSIVPLVMMALLIYGTFYSTLA